MKYPLATITALYILGIILGEYVPAPLPWLFPAGFALLIGAMVITRARLCCLVGLVLLAGWTNQVIHTEIISPRDLRVLIGTEPTDTSLRGRIRSLDVRRYESDGKEKWRSFVKVEARQLLAQAGWQPAEGMVLVTTYESLQDSYFPGQEVEISGVLHQPALPIARGLFDYRSFLGRQGIHYQLDAYTSADWKPVGPAPRHPLKDRFLAWSKNTLFHGLLDEDQSLRLIWAMTLGWRSGIDDEVSEDLMRSGTMHIFAISGLHIALIAGILVQLLRVFRVPRAWCAALVIPTIWFYTGATGWQPSAIRSSIMMTIVIGGWSLKRPTNLLNSLGAAGFVILLWEPQQLFQASFQLSFFVVLSLALLLPAFEKLRKRFTQHDPFLPPELLPRWHRFIDVPVQWLSMMFVTSLAAWIGSLPFVATYFHLFTPVTLLANVVIVPLSSFALMCNLGSLLCAPFLPPIAELFNHGAWFFMYVMVQATGWFANAPAAYFYVPAPTLAQSGLYFVVVFSLVTGVLFEKRWIRWLAPICSILLCVSAWQWLSDYQSWKITILPVDGGDAVFIDAPGRRNDLMVDCGSDRSVEYVTKPFLRSQGVNSLETLLLTHGDVKHMGGATNVVREFGVRRVCISPVKHRSSTYRSAMDWLAQQNELSAQVKQGDRLNRWTVLHPSAADKFPQADDGPVVLRGEINKTSLLLLSDLSRAGQHLLWERAGDLLRSDIVVTGLPREGEPLNEALLDTIAPKLIVVTDSEFPASERAPATLRQRLAKRGIQVIYCREAGAVTLEITERGFKVTTSRP